ncbi:Hemerythrin-like metal-binding domain-containing protein [Gammaproteobacteria bacterium]
MGLIDIHKQVAAREGLAFNSLKQIISWCEDFKVEQPKLDSQHESIFRLAVEASELAREPVDSDKLKTVFGKFGSVLEAHFHYEEGILAEIKYPKLEEHRAEHNAMLSELEFIRQRLSHRVEGCAVQQRALVVLNFLLGVTVGHILTTDVDYARHMQMGAKSG